MDKERKQELKVGTFTVASLVVFIVMIFAINGMKAFFSESNYYQVRFHNVGNLKENAAVFYSGYEIGKVTEIDIDYTDSRPALVHFKIPTEIFICDGDSLFITTKGLVGSEILAILPSVPRGQQVAVNTEFYGMEPLTLTSIYGDWGPRLDDVVVEAREVLRGVNQVVSDPQLHRNINATVADADQLLISYRNIADDNREGIRQGVHNFNELTTHLKRETEDIDKLITTCRSVLENVDGLTEDNRENLTKIIANATTISENLKAFSAEIEANPWKLLRRP